MIRKCHLLAAARYVQEHRVSPTHVNSIAACDVNVLGSNDSEVEKLSSAAKSNCDVEAQGGI